MSDQDPQVPIDKLTKIYIKIRDAREGLARKYEEDDADLKAQLETIKSSILDVCKALNVDSLKTQYGTVSRTVKTRYWPTDWDAMHHFIKEHDALDLLERRVHQTNMKTFLSEHPDVRPPGLNADSSYDVSVRRSK